MKVALLSSLFHIAVVSLSLINFHWRAYLLTPSREEKIYPFIQEQNEPAIISGSVIKIDQKIKLFCTFK